MPIRPHPHTKVDLSSMSSSHLDFYIHTGTDHALHNNHACQIETAIITMKHQLNWQNSMDYIIE